jgi:hypothetical protein
LLLLAIGDHPATERPLPVESRPEFQASMAVAVVRQEHLAIAVQEKKS